MLYVSAMGGSTLRRPRNSNARLSRESGMPFESSGQRPIEGEVRFDVEETHEELLNSVPLKLPCFFAAGQEVFERSITSKLGRLGLLSRLVSPLSQSVGCATPTSRCRAPASIAGMRDSGHPPSLRPPGEPAVPFDARRSFDCHRGRREDDHCGGADLHERRALAFRRCR